MDLKTELQQRLQAFAQGNLRGNALALLNTLGYSSEKTLDFGGSPTAFLEQFDVNPDRPFHKDRALFADWQEIHLLFQMTDEELSGEQSLFSETAVKQGLMSSYLFFALRLKGGSYARGKLAQIARQLNRIFPMPVMVVFEYDQKLSIAVINRRPNKRDADKDVLGKVTLIQEIGLDAPHRGHLDILSSFAVSELKKKKPVNSFDTLHAAWEEVFNVELLNKSFYQKIQEWFFWAVQEVRFPHGGIDNDDQRNRIATIRLLTRIIFCWFAKEKGLLPASLFSTETASRVLKRFDPADRTDGSYYLAFLQNLFFPTLSIPLDQREFRNGQRRRGVNKHYMKHEFFRHEALFRDPEDLGKLFADIPFLNGGLFECLDTGTCKANEIRADGFSDVHANQPVVPNVLFFGRNQVADLHEAFNSDKRVKVAVDGLFTILDSFKFTVTENTPIEEEIALDPELLGRIFENLLAEFNPATEKTARKETGSFYTPRTIVDYMVNEALKAYLQDALCKKLPDVSRDEAEVGLSILFSYTEKEHVFTDTEKRVLLDAIYEVTILDPACGSGAFPMGMLQKLVYVLEKLDHGHDHWKQRILHDTPAAIKEDTRKLLERSSSDFQWKLGLIQRCIYGVDIQPIAVQIAKLRCFVSLLVDFKVNPDEENSGVPALPNLDFKFVAADSLIKPPSGIERDDRKDREDKQDLLGLTDPFFEEFADLAEDYFFVRDPDEKKKLRGQIEGLIEKKIAERESVVKQKRDELKQAYGKTARGGERELRKQQQARKATEEARARAERWVALWESYRNLFAFRNAPVGFFAPRYFFPEIRDGFDVVIGNPPYVQIQKFPAEKKAEWEAQDFHSYAATADIYCLFYERGTQLLKPGGHLCYITSNKWMRTDYGEPLRNFLSGSVNVSAVLDFGMAQNFGAATTYTCVLSLERGRPQKQTICCYVSDDKTAMSDPGQYFNEHAVPMPDLSGNTWVVVTPERYRIKQVVETQGIKLEDWKLSIYRGVLTGHNAAFYLTQEERDTLIAKEPHADEIIVPLLRGRYVERYKTNWDRTWLINAHNGVKEQGIPPVNIPVDYPLLFTHLKLREKELISRQDKGDHWTNLRNCAYIAEFHQPKIIYPNMTKYLPFYYDTADHFFINDKAFIITSESEALPYLTAVLNSSLFRCCFRDNFPELLGNTYEVRKVFVDKIPIKKPTASDAALFEKLVAMVQLAKRSNLDVPAAFIEQVIDACVLELYFPDEASAKKLQFMQLVSHLLEDTRAGATVEVIEAFFATANDSKHRIRNQLIRLAADSPDLFAVIVKEGKV